VYAILHEHERKQRHASLRENGQEEADLATLAKALVPHLLREIEKMREK
jgi:hypothetical protein